VYSVKYINGTQWHIVDRNQETVFIGTKQQAEDWLDFKENAQRQSATSTFSLRRAAQAILLPSRRFVSGLSHGIQTGLHFRLPASRRHARKH
jgi:hypothetical protein